MRAMLQERERLLAANITAHARRHDCLGMRAVCQDGRSGRRRRRAFARTRPGRHEVDVYLPLYRGLDALRPSERLYLDVPTGYGRTEHVTVWSTEGRGYRLRLVDHPPSFDRPDYYVTEPGAGVDFPDNGFRFSLLARSALEAMRKENRPVDVIHGHDWEGAPAILLRRLRYAEDPVVSRAATAMTCHNLAYHGWVPRSEVAGQLDLPAGVGARDGVDLLREGILSADVVNTVSPGFARESLTPEFGAGVDDALRSLGKRYVGIINGIDTELWNPATDAQIPARYSAAISAARRCAARICVTSSTWIRTVPCSQWSAGSIHRRASTSLLQRRSR